MKIKLFAAGLASVLALGAMSSSVFAENITPSGSENESTGSSEVEHIISESYLINIPSKITLDSGSEPNFTGTANVSASNVRLGAGSSLTVSVKSSNGALKIVSDAITSTIPYTISINNQSAVNASDMVSEYSDVFSMEAGETARSAVPLNFTTTSFSNVKLAGEHKDMLSFRVDVVTPKFMQDIDSTMKADIASGKITSLKDRRDNRIYTVAAIAGKTWMTSDLAYVPEDYVDWDTDGIYIDEESGGVYYKWAVANNGDTCPKGWKIPSKEDFELLTALFDKDTIKSGPFKGVFYGYIDSNGSFIGPSSFSSAGHYWSTTERYDPEYGDYAYTLSLRTGFLGGLSSGSSSSQRSGNSVRCIAE